MSDSKSACSCRSVDFASSIARSVTNFPAELFGVDEFGSSLSSAGGIEQSLADLLRQADVVDDETVLLELTCLRIRPCSGWGGGRLEQVLRLDRLVEYSTPSMAASKPVISSVSDDEEAQRVVDVQERRFWVSSSASVMVYGFSAGVRFWDRRR